MVEGVLDLLLRCWSRELKVGKNGVRFKNMYYGQYDTDLLIRQGKKIRVAYDPDDLRRIYVYDAAILKLITIAEQNQLICYGSAVSEEDFREAIRAKARALKTIRRFRDAQLTANMDLTSLTIKAMQEAAEKPQTQTRKAKSIRPVRTPLDGQVAEHARLEVRRAVRKAAGAESISEVLDFDFSLLKSKASGEKLEFFNNG